MKLHLKLANLRYFLSTEVPDGITVENFLKFNQPEFEFPNGEAEVVRFFMERVEEWSYLPVGSASERVGYLYALDKMVAVIYNLQITHLNESFVKFFWDIEFR